MLTVTSQRVVRSYFVIAGLYTLSAALIWGINTLFLLDAGLDILGVFIANGAFTAGLVLFEIPNGVLADTAGRRVSFLLSVATLFATTLGYLLVAKTGGSLLAFSAVSVVMGLGFTFYSGAVEAWLVDALESTGYDGTLDRIFARGSMVTGGAMLVGTAGGGLLGNIDLALPYVVRAGMLAAVLGVAFFTMHDWGFTPRAFRLTELPAEMGSVARASIRYGWHGGVRNPDRSARRHCGPPRLFPLECRHSLRDNVGVPASSENRRKPAGVLGGLGRDGTRVLGWPPVLAV